MFKIALLIGLAIAGANAQAAENAAAPEPYSYAYETDSHAASEQRDQNGKVTGFYTIADADGRQRRVEYIADENGFRAKVQTNEVGTRTSNPADVEVLASPPNQEQYVQYQTQAQQAPQQFVSNQRYVTAAAPATAPALTTTTQYVQQPGYAYGAAYPAGYGYATNQQYRYGAAYPAGYGYGYNQGGAIYGTTVQPAAGYYRTVSTAAPATYGTVSRYVSTVGGPVVAGAAGNYRTGSYQTIGVPATVGYTVGPASSSSSRSSSSYSSSTGNLLGSSNYITLKKREAAASDKN